MLFNADTKVVSKVCVVKNQEFIILTFFRDHQVPYIKTKIVHIRGLKSYGYLGTLSEAKFSQVATAVLTRHFITLNGKRRCFQIV
jgi:hypothetical protein